MAAASSARSRRAAGASRCCAWSTICSNSRTCRKRRSPTWRRCSKAALNAIKQRSLVFIISDFISAPGWERPLSLLNQRHEVLAIRLWDPREMELPDVGPIVMEDAETGEQLYVDTHDRKFRAALSSRPPSSAKPSWPKPFKRAGVDVLSLSTEEDLVRAIVRFATLRQQRRK